MSSRLSLVLLVALACGAPPEPHSTTTLAERSGTSYAADVSGAWWDCVSTDPDEPNGEDGTPMYPTFTLYYRPPFHGLRHRVDLGTFFDDDAGYRRFKIIVDLWSDTSRHGEPHATMPYDEVDLLRAPDVGWDDPDGYLAGVVGGTIFDYNTYPVTVEDHDGNVLWTGTVQPNNCRPLTDDPNYKPPQ